MNLSVINTRERIEVTRLIGENFFFKIRNIRLSDEKKTLVKELKQTSMSTPPEKKTCYYY